MDQSEVLKFEQTKTLRLSEAIRIGARIRPQCFGSAAENGGSCALVAGAEAMGFPYAKAKTEKTEVVYNFLFWELNIPSNLLDHVIFMNDWEKKSREEIADWLEKQGY